MDIFEYGKALTDLWTLGGKAFLSGQESAYRAFSDHLAKLNSQPLAQLVPSLSTDTAELSKASKSLMTLWSAAIELSATLSQKLPADEPGDAAATAVFRKMLDPRAWTVGTGELDEMLQRMAEGPRLADFWNVERKYARVFQAWLAMRRRSLEHTTVSLDAWLRAANKFSDQLRAAAAGAPKPNAKEILAQWVDVANQVLLETQRSEQFLSTQADLLRASTDLRFAQAELAEYYGQMFGVPTRKELDDVHKTVTELKRELRVFVREQRRGAAASRPAAAKPAASDVSAAPPEAPAAPATEPFLPIQGDSSEAAAAEAVTPAEQALGAEPAASSPTPRETPTARARRARN